MAETVAEPEARAGEETLLSSVEVAHEAAITYRQLDYWVRRGFLCPEVSRRNRFGTGIGYDRWWSQAGLEVARRMGILVAAGLPPELAASFARDGWPRAEIAPGVWIEVTA